MAREIRITIDDDELFERMKARKQALELSWEDVLYRGLRPPETEDVDPRRDPRDDLSTAKTDLKQAIRDIAKEKSRSHTASRGGGHEGFDPFEPESIERFVSDTVRKSTSWLGEMDWDEDLDRVTDAEDAVMTFSFLGPDAENPTNQIPLRVRLDVSGSGLDVEVVTVRRGKGSADMNAFDPGVRQAVIEGIASGETAMLELATGEETYRVVPLIGWTRGDDGRPQADEVAIDEVVFGDE